MVGDKEVCERWCVTKMAGGGGRGGGGIQNQKQEPHTKMWGTTILKIKTKKQKQNNK